MIIADPSKQALSDAIDSVMEPYKGSLDWHAININFSVDFFSGKNSGLAPQIELIIALNDNFENFGVLSSALCDYFKIGLCWVKEDRLEEKGIIQYSTDLSAFIGNKSVKLNQLFLY